MIVDVLKSPTGAVALLVVAAGVPYVIYETDAGKQAKEQVMAVVSGQSNAAADGASAVSASAPSEAKPSSWTSYFTSAPAAKPTANLDPTKVPPGTFVSTSHVGPSNLVAGSTDKLWNYTTGVPTLPELQINAPTTNLVGGPVADLRDVLRFDISPGWVPTRFARVTTVLAERNMDGLRVALVTGTQPHDIAGTLTYYFDKEQRLRRVQVHGLTGDPSQLAGLMMQFYSMTSEPSLGGHLYTHRWNNHVTSLLHVTPAPVMYATSINSRYVIFLELNQPSLSYGLSQEAQNVFVTGRASGKW